jgi:hypothetical protein
MNLTKIGNRFYAPQIETTYIVREPVLTSKPVSLRGNAFCLQNAGNCDILLDNGYTLAPGQNQWFGNYNELSVVRFDIPVKFLPATATGEPVVQRLEIIEVKAAFSGSGFWIDQPAMELTNTN